MILNESSKRCFLAALLFFLIGFIDPHFYLKKELSNGGQDRGAHLPTEGIAIYFVLDKSGSMSQPVAFKGAQKPIPKIELLKTLTREFIGGNSEKRLAGRHNDLIGLVSFARGAQVEVPLTLDHQALIDQLKGLNTVVDQDEDGTAIGYAIYKTAALIEATRHYAEDLIRRGKPAYEIKSYALILVTDGFQDPSSLDKGNPLRNIELVDAAESARMHGVKLYIVSLDPLFSTEQFALNRKLMSQIADLTGGKFFQVDSAMNLAQIYSEIDRLEKSAIAPEEELFSVPKSHQPHIYARISLYPYLIALGICCLFAGICLETLWVRRVP